MPLFNFEELLFFPSSGHFYGESMSRTAVTITLDAIEQALLQTIIRQRTVPEDKKQRVRAVLAAATGLQNKEIAKHIGLNRDDVGQWGSRWAQQHQEW